VRELDTLTEVALIEPFYGGSHKQLLDLLERDLFTAYQAAASPSDASSSLPTRPISRVFSLRPRKWHWRLASSALHFAATLPRLPNLRVLFCSSMLNLSELGSLRPDLASAHKVLYFHENQLTYPHQLDGHPDTERRPPAKKSSRQHERSFQVGYAQVLSALVADRVAFNSAFNRDSFLDSVDQLLHRQPTEQRVRGLASVIRAKCCVLYFPVRLIDEQAATSAQPLIDTVQSMRAHTADSTASRPLSADVGGVQPAAMRPEDDRPPSEHSEQHDLDDESAPSEGDPTTVAEGVLRATGQASSSSSSALLPLKRGREPSGSPSPAAREAARPLWVLWNHRWEYDKQPELFFSTLLDLCAAGEDFRVVVLGESYAEVPGCFAAAEGQLRAAGRVAHWGYASSRAEYVRLMCQCDVVVSTAVHEFFGVAVLEAVACGCVPLCPDRLAYSELYPRDCLFRTPAQLRKSLRNMMRRPHATRVRAAAQRESLQLERFSWRHLRPAYQRLFNEGSCSK